jgi:uncharacterized phage-associated protein
MYQALALSTYIVSKCIKDNSPISNLQLQKILYYIQRDFLKNGAIAFSDDIEAWQFGPVVPNVYYRYCGFGSMPITNIAETSDCCIDSQDIQRIDTIVEEKRLLYPWDMVKETHRIGGAWAQVYQNGMGNHQVIPVELIKTAG